MKIEIQNKQALKFRPSISTNKLNISTMTIFHKCISNSHITRIKASHQRRVHHRKSVVSLEKDFLTARADHITFRIEFLNYQGSVENLEGIMGSISMGCLLGWVKRRVVEIHGLQVDCGMPHECMTWCYVMHGMRAPAFMVIKARVVGGWQRYEGHKGFWPSL